ncbi:MAG: propanediol/glycerol family dehydratase large subunit, partial [Sarcina sp.]
MISKRFEVLKSRPINKDAFMEEWAEKGFIAMSSPYDPEPSIKIENGVVIELDGKNRNEFDFIDYFIADYTIDKNIAEKVKDIDSLKFARLLVDINTSREAIIEISKGFTPAKIIQVINHLNVVEMMMSMQKLRARKSPANQAHITNLKDNPLLIAADAAEGALRGFREEETTVGIVRYAPFNAIALLIGSQIGKKGVLTQCAVEEATELELGMKGFTTYAETMSVYGTENVFIDGDDTPYSKMFLNAAYASRGLKTRFTSGTGSEVLMGDAEKKSMLYLETRCLMVTKGAGSQGVQNGAVSTVGITSSVPSGIRAILAENLIAALLDLEVASSNDQTFSHSDIRRTARLLMQFLPGTDFIFSGYSGSPNYDNMFAGSNFDAEDFDDYNVLQRDLKVDGGLRPVKEEDVIKVRYKAAKVIQDLFRELDLAFV